MLDSETGNLVVFNGEIYNYRKLRSELQSTGHRFRSHSDTEVILKLYSEYGTGMLDWLRGMYAFAIWDQKRRGVFLARDPFGIKPLYIADDGKTLRFASQVKALLAGGGIDTRPDPAGHVGFHLWGHVPEPHTLYRGIRSLPAGTSLWIDAAGQKSHQQFFSLADEFRPLVAVPPSPEEAREELRAALLDSVRHHLIADVPVGVFLSSGLDSTTLAGLAKEAGVTDLRTIMLGFSEFVGTENDEVPLAEIMARHCNAVHTTRWIECEDYQSRFGHLIEAMDQPSIDGVNTYLVSMAAREAGLKVALSGLGGDELFAGYSNFRDIPRLVRLMGPFSGMPLLGRGFRRIAAPLLKKMVSPKWAGLFEFGGDFAGAYLLRRGLFMPWELPEVMDPDMARDGWRELHALPALRQTVAGVEGPRKKVGALETAWYMRNQLLRDADWGSMAHSLEVRLPLVDIELFRTVSRLTSAGFEPGKMEMAAAPTLKLPERIVNRKKSGFAVPMLSDLRKIPESRGPKNRPGTIRSWALSVLSEQLRETPGRVCSDDPKKVYIFRTGQLGDTLVSLPAFWRIAAKHPRQSIDLITNAKLAPQHVMAEDVLKHTGRLGDVHYYEPKNLKDVLVVANKLRSTKDGTVYHLGPTGFAAKLIRDFLFFRMMCGLQVRGVTAARVFHGLSRKWIEKARRETNVSTELLRRVDKDLYGNQEFPTRLLTLPHEAVNTADGLLAEIPEGHFIVAVGAGSKMSAKRWPIERYCDVAKKFFDRYPASHWVLLGTEEERKSVAALESISGRVTNLCGRTDVIESAAVLSRCSFYLGNDTGTMHLAAAMGLRCLAIFSARDTPGYWNPIGNGHVILRKNPLCGGCMLEICDLEKGRCLTDISVEEVVRAAIDMGRNYHFDHLRVA